jgi:hypothetical protein
MTLSRGEGRWSCDLAGIDRLLPQLAGVQVEKVECSGERVQIAVRARQRLASTVPNPGAA